MVLEVNIYIKNFCKTYIIVNLRNLLFLKIENANQLFYWCWIRNPDEPFLTNGGLSRLKLVQVQNPVFKLLRKKSKKGLKKRKSHTSYLLLYRPRKNRRSIAKIHNTVGCSMLTLNLANCLYFLLHQATT